MTTRGAAEQAAKFVSAVESWVRGQRWAPRSGATLQAVDLWHLSEHAHVLVARMGADGALLQIPLVSAPKETSPKSLPIEHPRGPDVTDPPEERGAVRGRGPVGIVDGHTLLFDGTAFPQFWQEWAKQAQITVGTRDELIACAAKVRPLGVEQSNTSVMLLGGARPLLAKAFRVLHAGTHPEVEIPSALTEDGWPGVPAVWAFWDLPRSEKDGHLCSAVVSSAVQGAADGFDHFVALAASKTDPYEESQRIGGLVGALHNRLEHLFTKGAPVPASAVRGWLATALEDAKDYGLTDTAEAVSAHVESEDLLPDSLSTGTIRIHGDLHLGQLLRDPNGDWVVVDFEGEPLRDLASRRRKSLAMRDVAGMLRSFDYAAVTGDNQDQNWVERARAGFLEGYNQQRKMTGEDNSVLEALELEKALYEVTYEGRYRPDRLPIPLGAVHRIIGVE